MSQKFLLWIILPMLLLALLTWQPWNISDSNESSVFSNAQIKLIKDNSIPIHKSYNINNLEVGKIALEKKLLDSLPKSKEKDQIIDLMEDFASMPPCAEKSLLQLLYYIQFFKIFNQIQSESDAENKLQTLFNELVAHLKTEDLYSPEIRNQLHRYSIGFHNLDVLASELEKILSKIRPLNLQLLFRLVNKVEKTVSLVQGKRIILFLGETGSGKSTTIHFLAGSKMKKVKINGKNHIAPDEIINPALKDVTVSASSQSETRHIAAVEVRFQDVGGYSPNSIVLCDTPGFEDTNGPEIDISNGISVIRAINTTKNVKPVVLVSYKGIGSRFQNLKKLIRLLAGMIPQVGDYISSFAYIFTNFPEEEKDGIHATLLEIKDTMTSQEKSDTIYIEFFNDMLKKTKKRDDIMAIDLFNDEPGEILDKLGKGPHILHPNEAFKLYFTQESRAIIEKQILLHQKNIEAALKRNDYFYLGFKLNELKTFSCLLSEQKDIKESLISSKKNLNNHLRNQYEISVSRFIQGILSQDILFEESIQQYKKDIQIAKNFEILHEYIDDDVPMHASYIQVMHYHIQELAAKIPKCDHLCTKTNLDKINLLANTFDEVKDDYMTTCKIYEDKLQKLNDSFESDVISHRFMESSAKLMQMSQELEIAKHHLKDRNFDKHYLEMKKILIDYLNSNQESAVNVLKEKKLLNQADINKINASMSILESAELEFATQSPALKKEIDSIYKAFIESVLGYFNNTSQKIKQNFENAREKAFKDVEPLVRQLYSIHKLHTFNSQTSSIYYETIERLYGMARELTRDIQNTLDLIFEQKDVNYQKFSNLLLGLKYAEWIEEFRTGIYKDIMEEIKDKITQYVQKQQIFLDGINIKLENYMNIQKGWTIISQINNILDVFKGIFTIITPSIERIYKNFKEQILDTMNMVNNSFDSKEWINNPEYSLDAQKLEHSLEYSDSCSNIQIVSSVCSETLSNLRNIALKYGQFIKSQIDLLYNEIISDQNSDKMVLLNKSDIILSRLSEVSDLQSNCPKVFSYFPKKLIEKWQMKLSQYAFELDDEMGKLLISGEIQNFKAKLTITISLLRLDKFISSEPKFATIRQTYMNKYYEIVTKTSNQISIAIKNYDYRSAALQIGYLRVGYELEQVKLFLNASVTLLMDDTHNKVVMLQTDLQIEEIKVIMNNFKKLDEANYWLSAYLDNSTLLKDYLVTNQLKISKKILECINKADQSFKIITFMDTNKKIENIDRIIDLYGSYLDQNVIEKFRELKDNRHKRFTNITKEYSKMSLNDYVDNPLKLIFSFFSESDDEKYQNFLNELKNIITQKFIDELNAARQLEPADINNIHIRKCMSALESMPEFLQVFLSHELAACKKDISKKIEDDHRQLNESMAGKGKSKDLKDLYEKYKRLGMHESKTKISNFILSLLQNIKLKMIKKYKKGKIVEAFENMNTFVEYNSVFGEQIKDVKDLYDEIKVLVSKWFGDSHHLIVQKMTSPKLEPITSEIAESLEKSFEKFNGFLEASLEQSSIIDILPQDFESKVKNLNSGVNNYFNKIQMKFEESLKMYDIPTLKSILDLMKNLEGFFSKIKHFYQKFDQGKLQVHMHDLLKAIERGKTYVEITELISQNLKNLLEEFLNEKLINDKTKEFQKNRDDYYQKLNRDFLILKQSNDLKEHLSKFDGKEAKEKAIQSLEESIEKIVQNANISLHKLADKPRLTPSDCTQFLIDYNNLVSFDKHMNVKIKVNQKIESLNATIVKRIENLEESIANNPTIENTAECLKSLKSISNSLLPFKDQIDQRIDQILDEYKIKQGSGGIARLGTILNQDSYGNGQLIIAEHACFKGYSVYLFNSETQKHDYNYILKGLKTDNSHPINIDKLKRRYEDFESTYKGLIQQHLHPKMEFHQLISDLKALIGDTRHESNIIWDAHIQDNIPKLLSHIFALWTLTNAKYFFDNTNSNNSENYLLMPHPAQVLSIFRMLGIDDTSEGLKSNLVQIKTGEGKSLILAATASVFSLLGFNVNCVCYSEYLSQRDYAAFQSLFADLGVTEYIHYGTFNKLCEEHIDENGAVRDIVTNLISNNKFSDFGNTLKKRPKILLIDEVDVFFSKDFYGMLYTPLATLRDPTITNLMNYIWKEKDKKLKFDKINQTQEYMALLKRFDKWSNLMEEATRDMLADVTSYQFGDYLVKNDKIGYKEQDSIVYNIAYGYKTSFLYYTEHEKQKISRESLEKNLCIRVKCGSFSYAEIPHEFKYIMGVTGTLESLSSPEKDVIEKVYNITKNTYTPSMFGKNNLVFRGDSDIKIENEVNYFNEIVNEINLRIVGTNPETERAILVFFESRSKLFEFYNSNALSSIKEKVYILTEEASPKEKDTYVRYATISGQITLLTRSYGRGTDFISYDKTVLSNGGIHVIQTFLSEEKSEEVQIKGRTARQGARGSYSMILLDNDLEKYLSRELFEQAKNGMNFFQNLLSKLRLHSSTIYDILDEGRNNYFKLRYDTTKEYVQDAKLQHEKTQDFLLALNMQNMTKIQEFLVQQNSAPRDTYVSRTICMMDGTGSMSHLMAKAKITVGRMFERATNILIEESINPDSFQIQFAVYRNYNVREDEIIQASPWERKPENLRLFIENIEAKGGWGNEAIELALWYANEEANKEGGVTQVILIGDAAANSDSEVDYKRSDFGERYWQTTKFSTKTNYKTELNKLIQNEIPVHAFYVAERAKNNFKEIAAQSGGRCENLDVNSAEGAEQLTNLVTEEILRNIGGSTKGEQLVKAYRKRYAKGFT